MPKENRRRSSILGRRSICSSAPTSHEVPCTAEDERYCAEAKAERDDWDKLFQKRKLESKAAEQNYAMLVENKTALDFEGVKEYIEESDLELLSQMPDYSVIEENVEKYFKAFEMLKLKCEGVSSIVKLTNTLAQASLNQVANQMSSYNYENDDDWIPKSSDS